MKYYKDPVPLPGNVDFSKLEPVAAVPGLLAYIEDGKLFAIPPKRDADGNGASISLVLPEGCDTVEQAVDVCRACPKLAPLFEQEAGDGV